MKKIISVAIALPLIINVSFADGKLTRQELMKDYQDCLNLSETLSGTMKTDLLKMCDRLEPPAEKMSIPIEKEPTSQRIRRFGPVIENEEEAKKLMDAQNAVTMFIEAKIQKESNDRIKVCSISDHRAQDIVERFQEKQVEIDPDGRMRKRDKIYGATQKVLGMFKRKCN